MNFLIFFLLLYIIAVSVTLLSHIFTGKYLKTFKKNVDEEIAFWEAVWGRAKAFQDGKIHKRDVKKMKRPFILVAFYNFLKNLSQNERIELLIKNEGQLIRQVRKLDDAMKTYFVFIIGDFKYPEDFLDYHYDELLVEFVQKDTVHLRENSLKALYHFGHAETIREAFLKLSNKGIMHSEKLLSDGLCEFPGNMSRLADCLMMSFDSYLDCYKDAVVTFLYRQNNHSYDEVFKWYLERDLLSPDIQCAILRLLGKEPTEKNGEFIAEYYLTHNEKDFWESMIVAVGMLGNFKKTDYIVKVLQIALTSSVWYVRMNSAKSLCRIGLSEEEIADIRNGEDRYAKDAINYVLSKG